MRVAVIQTDPKLGEPSRNIEGIVAAVEATDADLLVFSECAVSGYGFTSRHAALDVADTIPGPSTEALSRACAASGHHVIVGLLERSGDRLFNTAVLVGPDGPCGHYRKMHLPFLGVDRFSDPGDLGFPVFETSLGRIGILICFDLSFPEAARCLKLSGAQVICVPTNWPEAAAVSCLHSPPVRAQENHVFIVTADRVGVEGGFRFRGESRICDVAGRVLAVAKDGEETIVADIDPAVADDNRLIVVPGEYELDRVGNRRPEHYGLITQRRTGPARSG